MAYRDIVSHNEICCCLLKNVYFLRYNNCPFLIFKYVTCISKIQTIGYSLLGFPILTEQINNNCADINPKFNSFPNYRSLTIVYL